MEAGPNVSITEAPLALPVTKPVEKFPTPPVLQRELRLFVVNGKHNPGEVLQKLYEANVPWSGSTMVPVMAGGKKTMGSSVAVLYYAYEEVKL